MSLRKRSIGLLITVVLASAWAGLWWLRQPRTNEVMRGWQLARQHGCFSCHGYEGRSGAANPGSDEKKVPSWDGGMLMMYVENPDEIREWILFGSPLRLKGEGHESLIEMPAYEDLLSTSQVEDLTALVRVVGQYQTAPIPDSARRGRRVAQELGCLGCHRLQGLVGTPNPGSWKGYIPPWRGPDFEELVRNEKELTEWILEGRIERLQSDPLARFFTTRQKIQMPAYRGHISESQLDDLVSYIQWLSKTELVTP